MENDNPPKARIHNTGDSHYNWKGGVNYKRNDGYKYVYVTSDNPYFSMARHDRPNAKSSGYIPEHRLIMAQHLGKVLKDTEVVHHINHIRDDNRIENLELMERPISNFQIRNGTGLDKIINNLRYRFSQIEHNQYENLTIEELIKLSNFFKPHTELIESAISRRLDKLQLQRQKYNQ
jgi:hypothetical protein